MYICHLNSRKIIITLNLLWRRGKKKIKPELSVENTDREILTTLNDEIDGETQFCLSSGDILKKLLPCKNLFAKSKKMSLLVELIDDWSLLAYLQWHAMLCCVMLHAMFRIWKKLSKSAFWGFGIIKNHFQLILFFKAT